MKDTVTYNGREYHVVSMGAWGSVQLVTLRLIGSLHTVTVPLVNVSV